MEMAVEIKPIATTTFIPLQYNEINQQMLQLLKFGNLVD